MDELQQSNDSNINQAENSDFQEDETSGQTTKNKRDNTTQVGIFTPGIRYVQEK